MTMMQKVKIFFGFEDDAEIPSTVNGSSSKSTKESVSRPVIRGFRGTLVSSATQHMALNEIKVEEPRIYEDSLNIATHLREGKPVIVSLKYLDSAAGKRLIDFVCGTAYAINGHMLKIGENIFLFTPEHVLIAEADEKSTFEQGLDQDEKENFFKKAAL
ncbi:MAG: cell division protein SepF [Candidatus Margulisiibacteriota bacterium]